MWVRVNNSVVSTEFKCLNYKEQHRGDEFLKQITDIRIEMACKIKG